MIDINSLQFFHVINSFNSFMLATLRENLYWFYSLREKVFTIKKIVFKSKNRAFTFKMWVFKPRKQTFELNIFFFVAKKNSLRL